MPGLSQPTYSDPNCLPLRHGILEPPKLDSEILRVFDEPVGDFNHLNSWHGQPKRQTQVGG
jgi:hypothetical protein